MTTARQEVEQELAYAVGKGRAGELLDAYAHALAEQIREHGGTRGDEFFNEAAHVFADLIDPEVTW